MNVTNFEDAHCERVSSYFDAYLNNELRDDVEYNVTQHIDTCVRCSNGLNDLLQIKGHLKRAVLSEHASEVLRKRIRSDIYRAHNRYFNLRNWMLAAAAVVVFAGGLSILFFSSRTITSTTQRLWLSADVAPNDKAGRILKVGFEDHISCAIDHGMANKYLTIEEMSERLRPTYDGLISAAYNGMPTDYEIVVGHRCHYQTREFLHLILRKDKDIISVIVTRKRADEAFPSVGKALQTSVSGMRVYTATWNSVRTSAVETRSHLAFVIHQEANQGDVDVALPLLRSVSYFLEQLEA